MTSRDDLSLPIGPVSGNDMAEWCRMLHDDNAIHLDRQAAEAAGFGPLRVNPGPANLAYVLSAAMIAHGREDFAEVSGQFLGNVFEDDTLMVDQHASDDNGGQAELRDRNSGSPVLRVRFTFKEAP